jgi:hypothetical protein
MRQQVSFSIFSTPVTPVKSIAGPLVDELGTFSTPSPLYVPLSVHWVSPSQTFYVLTFTAGPSKTAREAFQAYSLMERKLCWRFQLVIDGSLQLVPKSHGLRLIRRDSFLCSP